MKFRPLSSFLFLLSALSLIPAVSNALYGLGASTGTDLPYSVKTKVALRNLFIHHFNHPFLGAQVIALRGTPGKQYSGNYIDKGSLAGVVKGDVFALFTPKGDPVGFIKVSEVQRYTSTFEFIELTVDPSDNLVAEKITEEIKRILPANLSVEPDMGRFHKNVGAKKKPAPPVIGSTTQGVKTNPSTMPPLPGNTTPLSTNNNLPPLPGMSSTLSPGELPLLPDNGTNPTINQNPMENGSNAGGLPPLPMDNVSTLQPVGPATSGNNEFPSLNPPNENNQEPPALPDLNNSGTQQAPTLPPALNEIPALPPTVNDSGIGVPPLPEPNNPSSTTGNALDLPPLPSGQPAPAGNESMVPLLPSTGSNLTSNSASLALPDLPNSNNQAPSSNPSLPVPPISNDNNSMMPPDSNAPLLPPLNSTSNQGIPPLEDLNSPAASNNGTAPLPAAGTSDLDLPALPPTGNK